MEIDTLAGLISRMIILVLAKQKQRLFYYRNPSAAPLWQKSCTWWLFLLRISDNFGVIPETSC